LTTPVAALATISVTFSSIVWVSQGFGRFASAPTWVPRAASYGAPFPIRMTTGTSLVAPSCFRDMHKS